MRNVFVDEYRSATALGPPPVERWVGSVDGHIELYGQLKLQWRHVEREDQHSLGAGDGSADPFDDPGPGQDLFSKRPGRPVGQRDEGKTLTDIVEIHPWNEFEEVVHES